MRADKSIRNARWTITAGQWFLIAGLVFYSLMTTTPFVAQHSEWGWSGPVLGLVVDAAFVMSLSAESTLARHGVTALGRWPVAFRWTTGAAAVFLNVWLSIEAESAVGVAVHVIAPALVMLLAEVGPVYMAALADAANKAAQPEPERAAELHDDGLADTDVNEPEPNDDKPQDEPEHVAELGDDEPADTDVKTATDEPPATRLSNAEADAIIKAAWERKTRPVDAAAAAGRHVATVRRKFAQLDAELSV